MTEDTTTPEVTPTPEAPTGSDITSTPEPVADVGNPVIAPSTNLAAAVPTEVKRNFLEKVAIGTEEKVEEAFHELVAEIRKIYTSI